LIDVFARNRVADIKKVADYQQLCNEFAGNPYFQNDRAKVENTKIQVERWFDKAMGQQESARTALRLLISTRGNDATRDLCHQLITAGYKVHWTPDQQKYFDESWETIKLEYDYFLSFTNRSQDIPGDNPINDAYREFIVREIPDEYRRGDRKKKNLLALAVHRVLAEPGVRAFYFPHSQYDQSTTEKKLEDACNSCVVFIQLVQKIMFEEPSHGTNYCFFEWQRVRNRFHNNDKHMLYVVAHEDRDDLLGMTPFFDYDEWHGHITVKDVPFLPEARHGNKTAIDAIRATLRKVVKNDIEGAWSRLVGGVPA
jgi:hypothetical protein